MINQEKSKRYIKKDRRILRDKEQLVNYINKHNTKFQIVIGYRIETIDPLTQMKDIELTLAKR